MSFHWHCYYAVHVYFCGSRWSFWVEVNQSRFVYIYISVGDPVIKWSWISNIICPGLYYIQWVMVEVIVRFVNLHCLNICLINNGLQNTTQKTIDWGTRTPLKPGSELKCSGSVGSSCSTSDTCYSCYKTSGKSWIRKGPDNDCEKRNISVVICDTDTP